MSLRTEDFESSASTNFTTPADQRGWRPRSVVPIYARGAVLVKKASADVFLMPGILLVLVGAVLMRVGRDSREPEPPPVERTPGS